MTIAITYPGVYVEELPSGVHTITGVSTSNTAFVDYFSRGPTDRPVQVTNLADFNRIYGGLDPSSEASFAIMQYFLNGGQVAWVMRVVDGATAASVAVMPQGGSPSYPIVVRAANEGDWGNDYAVSIETVSEQEPHKFNLKVLKDGDANPLETYYNLVFDNRQSPNYAASVVNNQSALIQIDDQGLGEPPTPGTYRLGQDQHRKGSNGSLPSEAPDEWATRLIECVKRLATVEFEILCLPITALFQDNLAKTLIGQAQQFCQQQRAFYIVDPPPTQQTPQAILDWQSANLTGSDNAYSALYFPRLTIPDPLNKYRPRNVGPSGTIAGVYARTDASRGIWKAPAGTDAIINGASVASKLTDAENGQLNPMGIDALRLFPVYGTVVWGARTLAGADQLQSDYKYIPVRRLTSFIESSLYQGTQWAVFEPNDATLWSSLRLSVDTFMAGLASQGAFYRYFVQCDNTTTTQSDIDQGICNIIVAFAPVKPAEFIVLQIQQLAGQSAS
jgi:uncharacterized protein